MSNSEPQGGLMRAHRVDLERQIRRKTMGRPINKRYFGRLADADDARFAPLNDTFFNIAINVQIRAEAETESGLILQQRSPNKFVVNDLKTGTAVNADGTQRDGTAGTGNVDTCTLVDKAAGALGANEMSIMGTTPTGQVRIKKLYNRTCRDFDNNRYKWVTEDDSTETVLRLTAI